MTLYNPYNLPDILHFHDLVDIEAQTKRLLEATDQRDMPHGIPGRNIIRFGFDGYRAWVHIKSCFEGSLHGCQNGLHAWLLTAVLTLASNKMI